MPVTAGLVMAGAALLTASTTLGWGYGLLTAATAGAILCTPVHPLWLLAAGALLLIALFLPWYGWELEIADVELSGSVSAWEVLSVVDVLLFGVALVALAVPAARAGGHLSAAGAAAPLLLGAPSALKCGSRSHHRPGTPPCTVQLAGSSPGVGCTGRSSARAPSRDRSAAGSPVRCLTNTRAAPIEVSCCSGGSKVVKTLTL